MIVLDTNVLSELMRPQPAEHVVRWVADQTRASLFITSITQAEILHGILLLPAGKLRDAFDAAAEAVFNEDFAGRVLPFDSDAARPYARIATQRRRGGRPISRVDAQIAAIARAADAAVATRNVEDFAGCEVRVGNPWL